MLRSLLQTQKKKLVEVIVYIDLVRMSFLLMSSQKEEESTFSQSCNAFELQEEVRKLKEQLRDSEAEIQQLKVELGQYLFLEDKDKRDRKRQILPGVSRSDESRQYAASSSCNEKGLDESLLVEGVCLGRLPGMCTVLLRRH